MPWPLERFCFSGCRLSKSPGYVSSLGRAMRRICIPFHAGCLVGHPAGGVAIETPSRHLWHARALYHGSFDTFRISAALLVYFRSRASYAKKLSVIHVGKEDHGSPFGSHCEQQERK